MKSSFCFANVESVTVPATSFIDDLGPLRSVQAILGADHSSLEGGGVISKKNSCKRLLEEKNCMQQNEIEKNPCTAASKKKNVAKLFHHSWGALQNPSKTVTIPDNLQASEPLWLAY